MPLRLLDPDKGTSLNSTTSTNDWIKSSDHEPGSWVLAENQLHGRGRKGNSWKVLGEENIIFSGKIQMGLSTVPLTLLSLFAGAALLKSIYTWLPDRMVDTKIKWPNDIYRSGKKISGFLLESEVVEDLFTIVIGFGLNLSGKNVPIEWENIVGFLMDEPSLEGTKERILFSFIDNFNQSLMRIMDQSGLDKEIQWIESNSTLVGKNIQFSKDGLIHQGKVLGYDRQGFLIVLEETGMKSILMDTDPKFGVIE